MQIIATENEEMSQKLVFFNNLLMNIHWKIFF